MLRHGATAEEVVKEAVSLSREAYRRQTHLEKELDLTFGSAEFRTDTVDPLLDKERQIESIRNRANRGGRTRTSDTGSLGALLGKKIREYEALRFEFPWSDLDLSTRKLVKSYIEAKREQYQYGDVERVRASYLTALAQTALAS